MVSSDFGHMLSVGVIHFEDRFSASKKVGIERGGKVSAQGVVYMAAALAGYRMALLAQTSIETIPLPL